MLWLAGVLSGTLMGMIFVAHFSVVFALHPPIVVKSRPPESTLVPLITLMTFLALLIWVGLGAVGALAFDAAHTRVSMSAPGTPSVLYSLGVVGVAAIAAVPLLLIGHGRGRHILVELVLFVGVFGWLIPTLATAR